VTDDRDATPAEIEMAAHSLGYETTLAIRPYVDRYYEGVGPDDLMVKIGTVSAENLQDRFMDAVNAGLTGDDLAAWSKGLHAGAQRALREVFGSHLEGHTPCN
jgi:hypothetical protein